MKFSITELSFKKLRLLLSPVSVFLCIVKDTAQQMENVNTVTLVNRFRQKACLILRNFSEVFTVRKSIFSVVSNKSLILNFRSSYQKNIKVNYS